MKYFFALLVCACFAQTNAQQISVVSKWSAQEIQQEALKGHFQWIFPEGTTPEILEKTAKYYTTSFTYTFDNESKRVDVFPVVDSEDTRRVMLRFLGANQVNSIKVGEEAFELYMYYEKFMKIMGK